MKKRCVLYLSLCLVMVFSICIVLSGLLVSRSEAYSSQIVGQWKMVANHDYNFDLNLQQQGDHITGTMTRTNGSEPVDRITGRVFDNGTIEFTRHREGAWKQNYQGNISQDGRQLTMKGNFNHDGSGSYPWSATRPNTSLMIIRADGIWKMVANHDYNFDLNLQQQGDRITGTMTRTNGSEPVDRITGSVSDNGTIEFTRHREGAWKQNYQGKISQDSRQLTMKGNFNHDGSGSYPWAATR